MRLIVVGALVPLTALQSPAEACAAEDPGYLTRQLITCIGNKRALLGPIGVAVDEVKRRLRKSKLRVFDAFAGSGIVSRFLKQHSAALVSNDCEEYAAVAGRCYLRNRSAVDARQLAGVVADLNARVAAVTGPPGLFETLYAPQDETRITAHDRVFYTKDNARRLDTYRRFVDEAPDDLRDLLLGPLLSAASIHVNTAGVFKGFYKDRTTNIGRFGGTGADALRRIKGTIELSLPILSRFECECDVRQGDANQVARTLRDLDLTYVDPPYNQHPYGSNYFMLNLLVRYQRPSRLSRVSGIPADWRRSGYNVRARSLPLLRDLLRATDSRFFLVSFNDEGFVPPGAMRAMLAEIGRVDVIETRYNAFRASRSFDSRPLHVTEQLFLVERGS